MCSFHALRLSANTRPHEKVSRENYEPCLQLSHVRSLYYGQTGSRAAPANLELLSPTRTALLCYFNLVSKALSVFEVLLTLFLTLTRVSVKHKC